MFILQDISKLPPGIRVLREGSRGEDVKYLQTRLTEYGYPIPADGQFGFITEDAVCQFQRDFGLCVDGIVGRKTWDYLKSPFEKGNRLIHIVKKGEKITAIARRHHIDPSALAFMNHMEANRPARFQQRIIIPMRKIYAAEEPGKNAAGQRIPCQGVLVPFITLSMEDGKPVFSTPPPPEKRIYTGPRLIPCLTCGDEKALLSLTTKENKEAGVRRLKKILMESGFKRLVFVFPTGTDHEKNIREWLIHLSRTLKEAGLGLWLSYPVTIEGRKTFAGPELSHLAEQVVLNFTETAAPEKGPFPYAPYNFMEACIRDFLTRMPPEKVLLQIRPGGIEWSEKEDRWEYIRRPLRDCCYLARYYKKNAQFYKDYQMVHLTRFKNNKRFELWCDNEESFRRKVKLLLKYNLPGLVVSNLSELDKHGLDILRQNFGIWENQLQLDTIK